MTSPSAIPRLSFTSTGEAQKVDFDRLYAGYRELTVTGKTIDRMFGDKELKPESLPTLETPLVANEFVAYARLDESYRAVLSKRSLVLATYALTGFANFGSIGIQIGGIGALAPNRRHDLARLGLRAMFAGTLANFMTACIAGLLL